MLNLNTPVEPSASTVSASGKASSGLKVPPPSGPPVWKILVLDQETKDILATVLRVQDLREIGVTLHVYVFSPSTVPGLVSGLLTIFDAKATSLVSATAVGRACHLLRCSNAGKYQENCTRPPEGPLRIFPPQLFRAASAVAVRRTRGGGRKGWNE